MSECPYCDGEIKTIQAGDESQEYCSECGRSIDVVAEALREIGKTQDDLGAFHRRQG